MKRTKACRILRASVAVLCVAWPAAAPAENCSAGTSPVAFGAYNSLSTTARDGAGSVTVSCNNDRFSYTVQLGPGRGTYSQRRMAGATGDLLYNLYTTASRNIVWGDGSGGTSSITRSGASALPIYGRIPARQLVQAGSYSDLIVVTVIY